MWKMDRYVIEGVGPNKVAGVEVLLRYIRNNKPTTEFAEHCTMLNSGYCAIVNSGYLSMKVGGECVAGILKVLLRRHPPKCDAEPFPDRSEYLRQLHSGTWI